MIVKIITTGKSLKISLEGCTTVRDIAKKIALSEGVEENRISLIKRGKPLKFDETIEKCEIDESSSLIGVIQKPSPNAANVPSTPMKEEKKDSSPSLLHTSNQANPSSLSQMQPPVPLPTSAPLLRPGKPNNTSSSNSSTNITPTTSFSTPANETDAAYAKRVLSEPEMMKNLLVCSQIPQMCDDMMELIESSDVRLFNYIVKNPGVLVDAIVEASKLPLDQVRQSQLVQRQQQMQQDLFQQPLQPQQMQIELSEEDVEAINALRNLGFSEEDCIAAYLACNRNVELAASFLFGA